MTIVKHHWYAVDRKEEVEKKNFKGITKLLKTMEKLGTQSRQTVTITFSGYDHIADEIFEIDDIRKWVNLLLFRYPQILYYINVETEGLQNLLICYCDIETVFIGEKKPSDQYSIEDFMTGNIPQQDIYLTIDDRKLQTFKKAIIKEAKKHGDLLGGGKVIADMEKILS